MATPHISGLAALLEGQYPGEGWEATKARILFHGVPNKNFDGISTTEADANAYLAISGKTPCTGPKFKQCVQKCRKKFECQYVKQKKCREKCEVKYNCEDL
jgi:hypothetical protein